MFLTGGGGHRRTEEEILSARLVSALLAAMAASAGVVAAPAGAVPPGPNGETPRVSTATGASVPAPAVTGPIANTSPVGDPAHGYPFLATDVDLAAAGYVEEEYLISGQATRYTTSETATATVLNSGNNYSTRIVVRRPVAAAKFNGVVIAEWMNVTNSWDQEVDWFQTHEHLIRQGFAWVGVSAQRAGLHSATGPESVEPVALRRARRDGRQHGHQRLAVLRRLLPGGEGRPQPRRPRPARLAGGAGVRDRHRALPVGHAPAHVRTTRSSRCRTSSTRWCCSAAAARCAPASRRRLPHQLRGRPHEQHRQRRARGRTPRRSVSGRSRAPRTATGS